MKLSLFSSKNKIMNLVITDHVIRFVELKQADPLTVTNFGERQLPPGIITNGRINDRETLAMILEQSIDEWKMSKRQVRFLVPEAAVIIRKVTIPADVKEDEIKGYLYLELGTSIHLPFDEPIFDIVKLGEVDGKQEILIFAAQEEKVLEYSELLTDLKLVPLAAEISPLSLYRLYHHEQQQTDAEAMLLVQVDTHMVNISIFDQHLPIFMHHLPHEQIESRVDLLEEVVVSSNDLVQSYGYIFKEVNRLMDFYRYSLHQDKKQIIKILVNGDHPHLTSILTEMVNRYDVPVKRILSKRAEELSISSSFNVALGLAIREV